MCKCDEKYDKTMAAILAVDNSYSIFRPLKSIHRGSFLTDYKHINTIKVNVFNVEDVLKDIFYMYRASLIDIDRGDIVVIKINRRYSYYEFMGFRNEYLSLPGTCFIEKNISFDDEIISYVHKIHSNNKVFDLITGKAVEIRNIDLNRTTPYAIDYEGFKLNEFMGNKEVFDYYLYFLNRDSIECANPKHIAFNRLNNAIEFFYKFYLKKGLCLLLLDKKELEMVKEYNIIRFSFG